MKIKLDFEIKLTHGISITRLSVIPGKSYELEQLNAMKTSNNIIKGEIEIDIVVENITIRLLFAGEPNLSANIDFSFNNKSLFKETQLFVMPSNGKGKFESKIKLPL